MRAGIEVPPHIFNAGPAGFVAIGIGTALTGLSKAPFFELKPMLNELLGCVKSIQRPGMMQPVLGWNLIETQIEEPATIFFLYEEVVSLALGFSIAERLLSYRNLISKMMESNMPNTETAISE